MLLLVLTFVLWGIGDVLTKHNRVLAFKVGSIEYTQTDWQQAFKQYIHRLSQQIGKPLTATEIKDNKLQMLVLNQLINSLIIQEETRSLGLLVSDDMVKYNLATVPDLQVNGKFNKDKFQELLRSIGQSETEFIKNLKNDIAQQNFIITLGLNRQAPQALVEMLAETRRQKHNAQVIKIGINTVKVSGKPNEEELKKVYEQNITQFFLPEKRDISYIEFGINNVTVNDKVEENLLLEQYESKKIMFLEPEKRKVSQMIFKEEGEAKETLKKLDNEKNFFVVAKNLFPKQKNFSLGEVTSQGFEESISKTIFSTGAGKYSEVTKTPLGYHIFFVEEIIPARTKPFEEVKEQLTKQYLDEIKFEKLSEMAQAIDSQIASGATLSDIAEKYGLQARQIKNFTTSYPTEDKIINSVVFKQLAMATEPAHTSPVTPLERQDCFLILGVDKVEAQKAGSFSEVQGKVNQIWLEQKRQQKALDLANEVYKKWTSGTKAENIVTEFSLSPPQLISVSYSNPKAKDYPDKLISSILSHASNEVIMPEVDNENYYIARIISIEKNHAEVNNTGVSQLNFEMQRTLPNEIMAQYLTHLRTKYKVEIYEDIINSVVDAN